MIASTLFLYAATAFTLFSSATAATNITSAAQFFDIIPACVKACGNESLDSVKASCGDDFECACKLLVSIEEVSEPTNSTSTNSTTACFSACSPADQEVANTASTDLLTSCLPFFSEFDDVDLTSPNATTGNNVTTSTGVPAATQSANAGASLVMGSLLVVALPAVISGLFL